MRAVRDWLLVAFVCSGVTASLPVIAADQLTKDRYPETTRLPPLQNQSGDSSRNVQAPSAAGSRHNRPSEHSDQQSQSDPSPEEPDNQLKTAPATETADPAGDKEYKPAGDGFAPQPAAPRGPGGFVSSPLAPPPDVTTNRSVRDDNVEPGEVLVVTASMAAAQEAAQTLNRYGLRVIRRRSLAHLGFVLSTFRLPENMAVADAVRQIRESVSQAWVDANHHYRLQAGAAGPRRYARELLQWPEAAPECSVNRRIGLVDTGLAVEHSALAGALLETQPFLPAGIKPAAADHGTAIAALLIGAEGTDYPGLVPRSRLYAASVFHADQGQAVTTSERAVLALDWLVGREVEVINLSLAGEANLILELAVRRGHEHGIKLVAAAGNNGRDADPLYPAAYDEVIAVTAVDAGGEVYASANQGGYIDFAAPGVDVWTAAASGGSYMSGTSFAVPFVTAAVLLAEPLSLQKQTRDLGTAGHDPVYGYGLVQFPGCS